MKNILFLILLALWMHSYTQEMTGYQTINYPANFTDLSASNVEQNYLDSVQPIINQNPEVISANLNRVELGYVWSRNMLRNAEFEAGKAYWNGDGDISPNAWSGYQSFRLNSGALEQDITLRTQTFLDDHIRLNANTGLLIKLSFNLKAVRISDTCSVEVGVTFTADSESKDFSFPVTVIDKWHQYQNTLKIPDWEGNFSDASFYIKLRENERIIIDQCELKYFVPVDNHVAFPKEFPINMVFRPLSFKDDFPDNTRILGKSGFDLTHAGRGLEVEYLKNDPEFEHMIHIDHDLWLADVDDQVFPGHILWLQGAKLASDYNEGESTLIVNAPKEYMDAKDKFPGKKAIVYSLDANGNPEWTNSVYVNIKNYNHSTGTFNVTPLSTGSLQFSADQAVLAPQYDNKLKHNYSPFCPLDEEGYNAAQRTAQKYVEKFADIPWDGLEFDAAGFMATAHEITDINNDLIADWGYVDGVNVGALSWAELSRELRLALGPDFIIQIDSKKPTKGGTRGWAWGNGAEYERFPGPMETMFEPSESFVHLSNILDRVHYEPIFVYALTKEATVRYGSMDKIYEKVPDQSLRMGLGTSCIIGMPHTFHPKFNEKDRPYSGVNLFLWDEHTGGDLNDVHWLGKPIGPARRITNDIDKENNLLENAQWTLSVNSSGNFIVESDFSNGNSHSMPFAVSIKSIAKGLPELTNITLSSGPVNANLKDGEVVTVVFEARCRDSYEIGGKTYEEFAPTISTLHPASEVILSGDWQTYSLSQTLSSHHGSDAQELKQSGFVFGLASMVGDIEIRNVRLYKGNAEHWVREFEKGLVFLNIGPEKWTFDVPAWYRRLKTTNKQPYNDGSIVEGRFTLEGSDALFLVKVAPFDTVSISSPAHGTKIKTGDSLNVAAYCYDGEGIASVGFRLDSGEFKLVNTPPYEYTFTNLSLGEHLIEIQMTDSMDNHLTSQPVSITVLARDSLVITSPVSGDTIQFGQDILVQTAAYDSDSIEGMRFRLDNADMWENVLSPPYQYLYTGLNEGIHLIEVQMIDILGNRIMSESVEIYVLDESQSTGFKAIVEENNQIDNIVKIYPTIVYNILNWESKKEIESIQVYNLMGEALLKEKVSSHGFIELAKLKKGMYLVCFEINNLTTKEQKIVKY